MASPPADTGSNSPPVPVQQTTASPKHSQSSARKPRQRKLEPKSLRSTTAPNNTTSNNSAPGSGIGTNAPPVLQQSVPRGPVQQYTSAPFIMNTPTYPVNGASFSPQQYQPQQTTAPTTGPGMPAQYAFHPYHAPPPGYTYAQYPSPPQMVMVPPQRPPPPANTPQNPQTQITTSPVPRPAAPPSGKRKRKSEVSPDMPQSKLPDKSDDEAAASGSDLRMKAHVASPAEARKRTKTQRACDSCRTRKIRCDVLADAEPPVCQHCKQYGFECTFFLPITETRFKKKKMEEEMAEKEKAEARTESPRIETHNKSDVNVFGPTSAIHLLHSLPSISPRIYEPYDTRYQVHLEVSKDGDGTIHVDKLQNEEQHKYTHQPKPVEVRLEREVIEKLLNAYFTDIAPIFPVITKAEFLAHSSPAPILLYSMCLVAAARRGVPQNVFDSLRSTVHNMIKADDVLSKASIANVQALLILCMMADCHSQFVPHALSALWIRLGTTIRMAQDLGLHRAEAVKQDIETRRRVWAACVISDRWTSVTYGHPYMIDVHDCDARLPSSGNPNDLYMDELLRLSILLGRVLKTIYTPSGLAFTDDKMLYELLHDIETWKENLPDDLKYKGTDSPQGAGLLHLLYACVSVIFWRVFMRASYTCPSHLTFVANEETWTRLLHLTGEAIDWLDANETTYDIWLLVAYSSTSCAIVQYNTWAKRKDPEAAAKLRKLRDCVRRWEGSLSPDHMSARRKTAEIISLLYEATQSPLLPIKRAALNPTSGVTVKAPADDAESNPAPGANDMPSSDNPLEQTMTATSSSVPRRVGTGTSPSSSSLVNLTPLPLGNYANVNPAMNMAGNVQVMSVLDVPQPSSVFEQFDMGPMSGIPRGLFDWVQWEFFPQFNGSTESDGVLAAPAAFLQQR